MSKISLTLLLRELCAMDFSKIVSCYFFVVFTPSFGRFAAITLSLKFGGQDFRLALLFLQISSCFVLMIELAWPSKGKDNDKLYFNWCE